MKFSESKFAIITSALCSFGLLLSSGFAAAWFVNSDKITVPDDGLTGSVLQKYFHDGDGSFEHPFQITRPKHYENMVLLHYEMSGFAEKKYYFEFGADLDEDGSRKFYEYQDGRYTGNTSTILDCQSLPALAPLGSEAKPFNAHINGNGLTISNFKVDATRGSYSDIGIFGYVDLGTCTNAYFRDFEIDTTGTVTTNTDDHQHDEDCVHFGYIAGHIEDCSTFTNVYVNNCALTGTSNGLHINNYGYYGKAVQDSLGSESAIGNNYQFELNAEAFYNYFNGAYNAIKDQRLLLRNTKETEGEENGIKDMNPEKVSSAITKNQLSYGLNGNTPTNTDGFSRNYSISTLGYRGYPIEPFDYHYQVMAKKANNAFEELAADTIFSNSSYDEMNKQINALVNGSTNDASEYPYNANFIYYSQDDENGNPDGWRYFHAKARKSNADETIPVKLDISFPVKITQRGIFNRTLTFNLSDPVFTIVLDKVTYSGTGKLDKTSVSSDGTATITCDLTSVTVDKGDGSTPTIENISNGIDLQYGNHKIAAFASFRYSGSIYDDYGHAYYGRGEGTSISQKDLFVSNFRSKNVVLLPDFSGTSGNNPNYQITGTKFSFVPAAVTDDSQFDAPIYGCSTSAEKIVSESGDYYNYVPVTGGSYTKFMDFPATTFAYDSDSSHWFATETIYQENTSKPHEDHFIGDSEELVASGYSSKNIDLVGGGVTFTSQSLGSNQINIISVPSESSGTTIMTHAITRADIGEKFYATERCPNSVVLYLKNTSNARDARDDIMGNIEFRYASAEAIGQWLVNLLNLNIGKPVFKKGDHNVLQLENFGTKSSSGLNAVISLPELRESVVMQSSYCALDKDGKILGMFNQDGTPGIGFTGEDEAKLAKIATYVIAIGCYSTNAGSTNTWITDVKFDYKAEAGYGGTFGSVGYRDAEETIDNTILNLYWSNPLEENGAVADFHYFIRVLYVKGGDNDDYIGAYHLICTSDVKTSLRIYNYYPSDYKVYVSTNMDGSEEALYDGTIINVDIPASETA